MDILVVLIEDDVKLREDSLVWELKDRFGELNVEFISKPDDAISYIEKNIDRNIIVLLDIDFPDNEPNGHEILERIVKTSKLIPVILWSGIDENKEVFGDFINNHAFAFTSKTATNEEVLGRVEDAVKYLKDNIANTLEDWIINKEDDKDKPIYFTGDGQSYSLSQLLKEVRSQTEVGKSFATGLNKLTIDLLLRKKERLNG